MRIIKKPKIMWFLTPVNSNFLLGGCLGRLKKWSHHFDTEKYDIEIVLGVKNKKQFISLKEQFDLKNNIKITPVYGINPPWKLLVGGVFNLAYQFRNEKPIIIHSLLLQSDILAALFKPKNTKLISSWEGKLFEDHRWSIIKLKFYKSVYRLIVRRIDKIIALCKYTKYQNMESTNTTNDKIKVIYSGLDIRNYRYSYQNRDTVLNIGYMARLEEGKCPFLFLELVKKVHSSFPNIIFHIGGDGPERIKMEQFVASEGLSSCVKMTGYVDNVQNFFSNLDIFIFLSKREGLPWTILEALASGLPTIASSVGGVPEIIVNGINGILLENENINELLGATLLLINNCELRKILSINSNVSIQNKFDSKKELVEIIDVYNECYEKKKQVNSTLF